MNVKLKIVVLGDIRNKKKGQLYSLTDWSLKGKGFRKQLLGTLKDFA